MSTLAECIEEGILPLTASNHKEAWNSYNLFRNIDESNTIIPGPEESPSETFSPEEIANFSEE